MKNLLLLTIATLTLQSSYSQKPATPELKSKADLFTEKAGALFQKETNKIGSIKELDIKTVTITDLNSGEKITAVRLETLYSSSISSDTKTGTFDKDEIDAVLKSLGVIKTKIGDAVPAAYTEITYRSRGGVEVGCFISKSKKSEWSLYLKLEKYDGNSYVFLDKSNVDELISLLQQAKERL